MNEDKNLIIGRNPVIEALKNERTIDKILMGKNNEGSIKKIVAMAKDRGILIQTVDKAALDRLSESKNHQGVIAFAAAYKYAEVDDMLSLAKERGEEPFIIILDNIEDPHNLGAIMRTAECAGAHGIIIGKRRSAGLTETVAKASAGAIEYLPCAKVSNIGAAIDNLKKEGLWITACNMGGEDYRKTDLSGSVALVIGSEGVGISKLVMEKCDFTASIEMKGKINSLNASNAAAILMYEVRRKRDGNV